MIPVADLDIIYDAVNGFGVNATVGATTAVVYFRQPDVDVLTDRIARDYTMRYRVASFPTLARGNTVVIASVSYKVNEIRVTDTGDEAIARMSKV